MCDVRFIRKKPASLLGSLSFLKNEPGLLDFENKRNLMRTLLSNPDENTRNALNLVASVSAKILAPAVCRTYVCMTRLTGGRLSLEGTFFFNPPTRQERR